MNQESLAKIDNNESTKEKTGITDEPQHKEQLNMRVLGDSASLRAMYLKVSDDRGELFGNIELENAMIALSAEAEKVIRTGSSDQAREFMVKLADISSQYHRQLNLATNMTNGILVKHQVRLGQMYIQQKRLFKKIDKTASWLDWFKDKYRASSLRSAQDFMKLAKTPNIIRYAVFGRERLLEIIRVIDPSSESQDPIGDFLKNYELVFDPEEEVFMEDWRAGIDTAVAMEKIKKIEAKEKISLGITLGEIKTVIDGGVPVDSTIISNMLIVKESGGSVTEYLERTVLGKGPQPALIERAEKKETVQVLSKKLKKLVEFYSRNRDAVSQISEDTVRELKSNFEALTELIESSTSPSTGA